MAIEKELLDRLFAGFKYTKAHAPHARLPALRGASAPNGHARVSSSGQRPAVNKKRPSSAHSRALGIENG